MYNTKDSKFKPPEVKKRDSNQNGDFQQEFDTIDKVTKVDGSDYESLDRPNSGLYGNFSEKDASIERLRARNKEGIEINNYSATSRQASLKVGSGGTAYDGRPIPEVYVPATSNGSVPPNAVVYKTNNKDRNNSLPMEEDTQSNKTAEPIVKHVKSKE